MNKYAILLVITKRTPFRLVDMSSEWCPGTADPVPLGPDSGRVLAMSTKAMERPCHGLVMSMGGQGEATYRFGTRVFRVNTIVPRNFRDLHVRWLRDME